MKHVLIIIFSFSAQFFAAQTHKFYTFVNDSVELTDTSKLILVYYSDHACFDCFIHVNDYLKSNSIQNYYFTVEKSSSAMNNYDIYTKLINRGVAKEKILFTKIESHVISPFFKIYTKGKESVILYPEVFEDKTTLELSAKLKKEIN